MNWKRMLGWVLAGFAMLLIVGVAGGYFYLRSTRFQQFAIRKIEQRAYLATGGRTRIGGLDFNLRTLTAILYDITLRGSETPGQPPLLHADKLTVRLKIPSLLHFRVELRELLLEHPVAHVEVSRDGKNNFPTPRLAQTSHTNVFDLAVGHAQLTHGEIDYNDRKTPLSADLYDLGANIHFEAPGKRYIGEISYERGTLRYGRYSPFAHSLDLKFAATPETLNVPSAVLHVTDSEVTLRGQVNNYTSPVADAEYRIFIHTQDFARMSTYFRPEGDVSLSGKLHYQQKLNRPLLRNISVDGQLASAALSAIASGRRLEVQKLQGTYRLEGGNLQVSDLHLDTLGGRLAGRATMKHLEATPDSSVEVALSGISLRELQRMFGQRETRAAVLSGTLRGNATARWNGTLNTLRAQSDVFVRGIAGARSSSSAAQVPVDGAIRLTYDGPSETLDLHNSVLKIPSATLTAQGAVSRQSRLRVQIAVSDLHQLATLASSFRATQSPALPISGSARVDATVQGNLKNPAIAAQLTAQNIAIEGSQWPSARMAMHARSSEIVIDSASIVGAHQGQAVLNGTVGLTNWSFQSSSPIHAQLNVQRLRLADLEGVIQHHYPISGDLSANVLLDGSELEPAGSGSAQIANAQAYGESIQHVAANFHTHNGAILSTLHLSAPAGAVDGNISYTPRTRAYVVTISAPSIALQKLQTVQEKNMGVNGILAASIGGQGTLDDPQLSAIVKFPQLQIRKNQISGFTANLQVAQHKAELNLNSQVSEASIHAHADIDLTGGYETQAVIDTGTIPLDPVMATYGVAVPDSFQGQTELHATVKGSFKDKSKLEAHLTIPVLKAAYQSLNIGIAQPIRADYANSVITLQPAELRGTGTDLRAQGRIPVAGTAPPTLRAEGSIDVGILRIFAPSIQSSGVLALAVQSSGKNINGQLRLQDVALTTTGTPVGVEKLNGTVQIEKDHLQITEMKGRVGGGDISLGGSVSYKPKIQFNLAVRGESMRLSYPNGLRSLLDANLTLSGTAQASIVSGRVLIDSLSFTPDFDLSTFAGQFNSQGASPSQPGFADTVKLAVAVQSGESLRAVSSQVSLAGQLALQVGGTAGDPVITGRTTLTSGELFYRNVRYQLQRGVITFDDPNQTRPVLNVSVTTLVEQYNLTLTLRGPLDKLTTSYVSDPPLATADIINLIARGQTTEEQAASGQSTDSMIASQVAGQLASSVQKLAGISALEIDPTLGGNQNPSARIAIQQRVTKNLLFSFSTDVSVPGSEIVQGEYQINKRWSVMVQRDEVGGVSVDGRFHTKF
jgi:translocation and assembly module TamB